MSGAGAKGEELIAGLRALLETHDRECEQCCDAHALVRAKYGCSLDEAGGYERCRFGYHASQTLGILVTTGGTLPRTVFERCRKCGWPIAPDHQHHRDFDGQSHDDCGRVRRVVGLPSVDGGTRGGQP